MLLDQDKLTERDCKDLYEKYFNFGVERETYQRAGDQINATLHDVSSLMQGVKTTTVQFTGKLKGATEKFTGITVPDELQTLINSIAKETEMMIKYNEELEKTSRAILEYDV